MCVILPSECDVAVSHGHETVVGDGHAVRIAGQILEYVFWSAKRRLGINHPILAEQLPQKGVKWFGLAQMFELPMEVEFPLAKEALQTGDELATKDAAEDLHWQKEVVLGMKHPRASLGSCRGTNTSWASS